MSLTELIAGYKERVGQLYREADIMKANYPVKLGIIAELESVIAELEKLVAENTAVKTYIIETDGQNYYHYDKDKIASTFNKLMEQAIPATLSERTRIEIKEYTDKPITYEELVSETIIN